MHVSKMLDESRHIFRFGQSLKPDLDEETKQYLPRFAKKLLVLLVESRFLQHKVNMQCPHVALRIVIKFMPRSLFYLAVFEYYFPDLAMSQKRIIFQDLLEGFNPDHCKLFSVSLGAMDTAEAGLEFFESWCRKLEACNFEGKDIDNHLVMLASLILRTESDAETFSLSTELGERYWNLVSAVIERVSIVKLMASIPITTSFASSLVAKLQVMLKDILRVLINRFMQVSVIEQILNEDRIALGLVFARFQELDHEQVNSIFAALPKSSQERFTAMIDEYNSACSFLRSEKPCFDSLEKTPMRKWTDLSLFKEAVDDFEYVARSVKGLFAVDSALSEAVSKAASIAFYRFDVHFVPDESAVVDYTRLIFALICLQSKYIQAVGHISLRALKYLKYFNTDLWPLIKIDPTKKAAVRENFSLVFEAMLHIVTTIRMPNKADYVGTIFKFVNALSLTPKEDKAAFISTILETDITFLDVLLTMPRNEEDKNSQKREQNDVNTEADNSKMVPFVIGILNFSHKRGSSYPGFKMRYLAAISSLLQQKSLSNEQRQLLENEKALHA